MKTQSLRASVFVLSLSLMAVPPVFAAGDIRTERVHFQKGASSAVVEDSIKGYETVDYVLGARKGQYMNVSMATDNGANYFNILAPGEKDVAFFIGSTSGNHYEGALPDSGDYKVRVYLMRSAARRNEVAKYRLEMIVTVTKVDGRTRAIFFEKGKAVACDASQADPGEFSASREGDLNTVHISKERYEIPDAVIFGG